MNRESLRMKKARNYLLSHIQRCGQKIRERGQDLGGLMSMEFGFDIPLPPYSSDKEKYPFHLELLDHIVHGLGMYAEAVQNNETPERIDASLISNLEAIFDEKKYILNKIRREVNRMGRKFGYQEFPSLRLNKGQKIEEARGELIEKLRESLDPSEEWKKGKPSPEYEKAREREEQLRKLVDDTFASSEFVDLQRFPYPRGSLEYFKELQHYVSNYFERFGRINSALKEKGVDLENLGF